MNRAGFAIFMFFLINIIASTALAQVPKRSVRLDLSTDLVQFQYGGWNPTGPEDWRHTSLDAGIGTPNIKLGVGVTVADALTVGLHIAAAIQKGETALDEDDSNLEGEDATTDFDAMEYTNLNWGVMPYLEYAFLQNVVRPFIMLTLGFEGEIDKVADTKTNYWDFVFGFGGGLHFFVSPTFSVDLGILFGFSAGGGNIEPEAESEDKNQFIRVLFRLNGGLGLSGWF